MTSLAGDAVLFDVERCRFDKARVVDDDGAAAIEHFESVVIDSDALRLASIGEK